MKKILILGALAVLASSPVRAAFGLKKQHLTVAPITNFEIWNKSKGKTLYFALGPYLNEKQEVHELLPGRRITGYYDTASSEHYLLYFSTTPQDIAKSKGKDEIDGDVRIYKVGPTQKDTTMYVRLGEQGLRFGPQSGPLLGRLRITETGPSLRKNIGPDKFDHFSVPKQPEWFVTKITEMTKKYSR